MRIPSIRVRLNVELAKQLGQLAHKGVSLGKYLEQVVREHVAQKNQPKKREVG